MTKIRRGDVIAPDCDCPAPLFIVLSTQPYLLARMDTGFRDTPKSFGFAPDLRDAVVVDHRTLHDSPTDLERAALKMVEADGLPIHPILRRWAGLVVDHPDEMRPFWQFWSDVQREDPGFIQEISGEGYTFPSQGRSWTDAIRAREVYPPDTSWSMANYDLIQLTLLEEVTHYRRLGRPEPGEYTFRYRSAGVAVHTSLAAAVVTYHRAALSLVE